MRKSVICLGLVLLSCVGFTYEAEATILFHGHQHEVGISQCNGVIRSFFHGLWDSLMGSNTHP